MTLELKTRKNEIRDRKAIAWEFAFLRRFLDGVHSLPELFRIDQA
jgi:hypothetical protein